MGLEDDKVFAAFKNQNLSFTDPVNNGVINALVTGNTGLTPDVAAQAFAAVEQFDIPVANIIVNAQQQRDLRLWTNRNYDPVTQRELLKTGYLGDLWGAMVRQSRRQTAGEVNFLGDPQYLGVISIRIDLSHMDAPDPTNLFYGWVFFEALGVNCTRPCGEIHIENRAICGKAKKVLDLQANPQGSPVYSLC